MGKKGGWFSAVKKALNPETNGKKDQKTDKPRKKWFGKSKKSGVTSLSDQSPLPIEDPKLIEAENEQSKHAYSVALATAAAAEAAVAAAQAAAEVVRLTTVPQYLGKSKEEIAAIVIQTAFRGYLARRALRALRGLVRLKSLLHGQYVRRQAASTLKCMQTLARLQLEVRTRRIRMSEENRALQQHLEQKRDKELEKFKAYLAEEWDDSMKSKEEVEAKQQNRLEAAVRRERALAYAFSHQQMLKNSSRSTNPTFMDPNNPHWGWSWLERWMAGRPWEETKSSAADFHDHTSIKSTTSLGEINRAYANNKKPSPRSPTSKNPIRAPSTPSRAPSSFSGGRKIKSASPKVSGWGGVHGDEDSRSILSVRSEYHRRHSIAGSSVRDDDSLTSLQSVPSYMAPTTAAKARSRLSSPSRMEKGSMGSAKKRLSFTGSPVPPRRRHSGPPAVDAGSIKAFGGTRTEDKLGINLGR